MKRNKKLLIILMVLIISPLIVVISYTLTANAYITQSVGGNQSYKHRQFDPNTWDGSLSPGAQGERWLLKSVNVSRNNFHNWLATGYTKDTMKMGAHGLENPNSYTPPSGWEIHTVLKYPVYTPRSYPVSIKDCTKETKGTATAPWTEPKKGNCSPSKYQTGLSSNNWVLSINAAHWEVYDTNAPTWEGKTGPFYLFNAAQINGYAYDVRIVKKGGPPIEPSPEPDPGEPEPDPEPVEPPNQPPSVNIEGPTTVMAGETFCLHADASDPDGQIINYSWDYSGVGKLSNADGCDLWYEYESDQDAKKTVRVTVMDDDGATASDDHIITVVPPKPDASFKLFGWFKENRKVEGQSTSKSPLHYPIDWSKSYFEISAADGKNTEHIRVLLKNNDKIYGQAKFLNEQTFQSLYKMNGDYKVKLYVENTVGLSDTLEGPFQVEKDMMPVANYSTVTKLFRDPKLQDSDGLPYARSFYTNESYSADGDTIAQSIYTVAFDTDNDNQFENDPTLIFDSKTMTPGKQYVLDHPNGAAGVKVYATMDKDMNLELLIPTVGNTHANLEVIEEFGKDGYIEKNFN